MRKHSIILITAIIIFVISAISCLAHSGRTDGRGGHYDRSSGEYHYHHGMSAHQHPNGVCPYKEDEEDDFYSHGGYAAHKHPGGVCPYDDDYTTKTHNSKTGLKFLGKLSGDHEWHMSDVIHLVIIALLPILAFIWLSEDMVWRTRKYGNLAFTLFVSVLLSGYSLSLIFPYYLNGLDFLFKWIGLGIIIPIVFFITFPYPFLLIYLPFSAMNRNDKNDKKNKNDK